MSVLLAVTFGGLVAVAVAAVLAFAVATNFKNTVSLLDDKATMIIQSLKFGLRAQLDPSRQAVKKVAEHYASSTLTIDDDGEIKTLLVGLLIGRPDVESVLIYDHNFVRRGIYRDKQRAIQEIEISPVGNKVVFDHLSAIKPDDPPAWSIPIYIPSAKAVFASVAAPLVRDGRIDGYLVAAITTDRLSRIITDLAPENGVTFILDGQDRILAHSRAPELGLEALRTQHEPTVDPKKTADLVLAGLENWKPIDALEISARAGVTVSEHRTGERERRFGPPFVVVTAKVEGLGPQPWTLGIYFAGNDIYAELKRLWISGVVGIVALIIAVIIAVWLARRIARPLSRVSVQASRIATLDIEDVADLPASRVREINTTAGAFNAMLEGLRAFTIYVPRSLVAKLVQSGMADTTRSREARLTIMFSDIAGFTTLSESLTAQETADLLNRHFEILVACVEAQGGTVDKFLGDGMLAFWGAPDQLDDHADAAVRAAEAIGRAITIDNEQAREDGRPVIRVRIGIHTGPVIVGNIGTYDRVNYTIVGDTVNVCQRIETLGKTVAPDDEICLLASADTMAELSAQPNCAQVGEHHLRGRAAPIKLWRIQASGVGGDEPRGGRKSAGHNALSTQTAI